MVNKPPTSPMRKGGFAEPKRRFVVTKRGVELSRTVGEHFTHQLWQRCKVFEVVECSRSTSKTDISKLYPATN